MPPVLAKVVEGDLLLASGLKEKALACYRSVAQRVAKGDETWKDGRIPKDGYVVYARRPRTRFTTESVDPKRASEIEKSFGPYKS